MKSYLTAGLLSLALLLTVAVTISLAVDDLEAWMEFKRKYNKTYASLDEESERLKIFIDNKLYVESHNTKAGNSFTQGINPLSDLTADEVNRSRNGFRLYNDTLERIPSSDLIERLLAALNTTQQGTNSRGWFEDLLSPPELDWRTTGRVSRVKDQGKCGSCWAYSTVGALESILASRGKNVLLSEQNLVDCSRKYGNHGCNGGLMAPALRYVRDFGIMASAEYPYVAKDENCKFKPNKSVMSVRGAMVLPRGNEALLRLVLSIAGPIPVAIDAAARSFHHYKSGVYNDMSCRNSGGALNHAVLLVGYGTDRAGGDYWLLKNSWGLKWGENGYIRVARNRHNMCGIASYAVLPIV